MRQEIIDVYEFNELSQQTKEIALENLRYINVEHDWWEQDGLLDLSQEEVNVLPAGVKQLYGNGSCMVDYKIDSFELDQDAFLNFSNIEIKNKNVFEAWLGLDKLSQDQRKVLEYDFVSKYRYNTKLEIGWFSIETMDKTIIENAQNKFNIKVEEALRMLQSEYEHLISDEAIIETINSNNYEFTVDGKLF